jgi:hypothetical protein
MAELIEPTDRSLNQIALTVDVAIKSPEMAFITLPWDGVTYAPAMQIGANPPGVVSFVANYPLGTDAGASRTDALDSPLFHERLEYR